jgi:hypothetical protein
VDRARYRFTGTYRFTPRFQAGVEYNPGELELGPIANWIAAPEGNGTPMVSFGTSSDRIGSPKGTRAYYATFAKSLPGNRFAPYVSVNYSTWDEQLNFPVGLNVSLTPAWAALLMNDGRKSHLLVSYSQEKYTVSLLWVWFRHPGIAFSVGF